MDIDIVPEAVVSKNGRESIEYHADLGNRQEKDASIAWSARLVDDKGQELSVLDASEASVRAKGVTTSKTLRPGALPDGAYMVRVLAAAVSARGHATTEVMQPFLVQNGKVTEIDLEQWATTTHAREAVTLAQRPTVRLMFPKHQPQPAGPTLPSAPPPQTPVTGKGAGK